MPIASAYLHTEPHLSSFLWVIAGYIQFFSMAYSIRENA